MTGKRMYFLRKWISVLMLSILYSISALAEEKTLRLFPYTSGTMPENEISDIPPFLNSRTMYPFSLEGGDMRLPVLPLKLLEQVERPCVKLEMGSITLSFSSADVEKFVRLHAKHSSSPSWQQEMVETVWAVIPPASDDGQCAKIPRTIPQRPRVVLSLFIRNVLDHLLTQGKAVVHTHTGQLVTTVYVRTKQASCPMCGRIPPWLMFYSLEPDSPPVWQGLVPKEYE